MVNLSILIMVNNCFYIVYPRPLYCFSTAQKCIKDSCFSKIHQDVPKYRFSPV